MSRYQVSFRERRVTRLTLSLEKCCVALALQVVRIHQCCELRTNARLFFQGLIKWRTGKMNRYNSILQQRFFHGYKLPTFLLESFERGFHPGDLRREPNTETTRITKSSARLYPIRNGVLPRDI